VGVHRHQHVTSTAHNVRAAGGPQGSHGLLPTLLTQVLLTLGGGWAGCGGTRVQQGGGCMLPLLLPLLLLLLLLLLCFAGDVPDSHNNAAAGAWCVSSWLAVTCTGQPVGLELPTTAAGAAAITVPSQALTLVSPRRSPGGPGAAVEATGAVGHWVGSCRSSVIS